MVRIGTACQTSRLERRAWILFVMDWAADWMRIHVCRSPKSKTKMAITMRTSPTPQWAKSSRAFILPCHLNIFSFSVPQKYTQRINLISGSIGRSISLTTTSKTAATSKPSAHLWRLELRVSSIIRIKPAESLYGSHAMAKAFLEMPRGSSANRKATFNGLRKFRKHFQKHNGRYSPLSKPFFRD